MGNYILSHLKELESEAIFVIRESQRNLKTLYCYSLEGKTLYY
jgi:hypothetical protein